MLGTVGSIASLAGLAVSLLGLGFAILQLWKLRGETRAAREASESAERAVRRDSAMTDLAILYEKIQALKDIHRRGDKTNALVYYRDIVAGLLNVQRHHPNLTSDLRARILAALSAIGDMERAVGGFRGALPPETAREFNDTLLELQLKLIPELQNRIPGPS